MGQVLIEIPQDVFVRFRVKDSKVSEQLLDDLEPYSEIKESGVEKLRERKDALKDVLGVWSSQKDTAQEIARKIRERNRKVT